MITREEQGPLKTDDEIIEAHDLLTGILSDPVIRAQVFGDNPRIAMHCRHSAEALCWVLNHRHTDNFEHLIAHLKKMLALQGLALVRE